MTRTEAEKALQDAYDAGDTEVWNRAAALGVSKGLDFLYPDDVLTAPQENSVIEVLNGGP